MYFRSHTNDPNLANFRIDLSNIINIVCDCVERRMIPSQVDYRDTLLKPVEVCERLLFEAHHVRRRQCMQVPGSFR